MFSGLLSFGVLLIAQVRPGNAWGFSFGGMVLLCSTAPSAEVSTSTFYPLQFSSQCKLSYQVTSAWQEMLRLLPLSLPVQLIGVLLGSGVEQRQE